MMKLSIRNVVVAAVVLTTSAGCLGPLSYRPPKPKAVAAPVKKDEHLPPAPDPKLNNATLTGIDSTGAGVRDDVQIWIFSNYSSPAKRTALMSVGKAVQAVLAKNPKTADEAKNLQEPLAGALLKLQGIPGINKAQREEIESELYLSIVNTPARSKAYLQYSLLVPAETWTIKVPLPAQAAGSGSSTATTAAAAAPRIIPGVTPGYGTKSLYAPLDEETDPAAAPAKSAATTPLSSATAAPSGSTATTAAAAATGAPANSTATTSVVAASGVPAAPAATPPVQPTVASNGVAVTATPTALETPAAPAGVGTGQASGEKKEVAVEAATAAPAAPPVTATGQAKPEMQAVPVAAMPRGSEAPAVSAASTAESGNEVKAAPMPTATTTQAPPAALPVEEPTTAKDAANSAAELEETSSDTGRQ